MKRKKKLVECDKCYYAWFTSKLPAGKCPKCDPKIDKAVGNGKLLWKNDEG